MQSLKSGSQRSPSPLILLHFFNFRLHRYRLAAKDNLADLERTFDDLERMINSSTVPVEVLMCYDECKDTMSIKIRRVSDIHYT